MNVGSSPEVPTIIISGFEFRPTRRRTIAVMRRIAERPSESTITFILSRAAHFRSDGRPLWNYPKLARNLGRARGVKLNARQVRAVVRRYDRGLYDLRRKACAPKKRIDPRTGERIEPHWLLDALDRIRAGGVEWQVLAKFGYVRKRSR